MALFSKFSRLFPKKPLQIGQQQLSMKERFAAMRNIPRFFGMIWRTNPLIAFTNLVLRVIRAGVPLALLYVGKLIINGIVHTHGPANLRHIFTLVVIEFALAIFSDLLNRATSLLDSMLGDQFSIKSSIDLMTHAATLDLDQFEDSNFYDMLERARRQTINRTVLMTQLLSQLQDFITLIVLSVGLVVFSPWLIVILLLAVIPAFLGESHFNERSYSLSHSFTPERRELDYLRYTGASDETAKEVKIFGLSGFLIDRFRFLSDKFYKENLGLSIRRASWGSVFSGIGTIGYYVAYVYIIYETVIGRITLGDLTFLSGSFARLRSLLEGILNRFTSMADGAMYLKDFFDFFDIKPKIVPKAVSRPFPKPIQHGFTFENVGFKYANAEKWALRNVSFHLKVGEKLALVGENGAGKTTLVKLLARLYDPVEGRILLDGYDLREYDPAELRKETGVIFQDFVRFQLTASQNIAVGRIEDKENLSKIKVSAAQSLADSVIEKLPEGYNQMIGKRFGNGVDLSGGEWQKVALGRAYMRDAQLLILDEPTAALDARAEHEVFVRFAELTKGKTAVLISHRFSTVRMADRILVLENGNLLEIGTHAELLAFGGRYAELFTLQAEGYK
jgi:ATP-binding cassette subfamily B protein